MLDFCIIPATASRWRRVEEEHSQENTNHSKRKLLKDGIWWHSFLSLCHLEMRARDKDLDACDFMRVCSLGKAVRESKVGWRRGRKHARIRLRSGTALAWPTGRGIGDMNYTTKFPPFFFLIQGGQHFIVCIHPHWLWLLCQLLSSKSQRRGLVLSSQQSKFIVAKWWVHQDFKGVQTAWKYLLQQLREEWRSLEGDGEATQSWARAGRSPRS